ncbi:MAG TPA: cytochrome c peroxidase [Gammaproteobacteria bacterium]|nr:cytochrome c peroxidase [Gammaproteobacteria bacterium]
MFRKASRFLILFLLVATFQAGAVDWQALPDVAPAPEDNPTTPEKVELGRMLYLDPRFSSTGTVSCNSCHNVMLGGEDNRAVSMGVHGKTGGRSSPTVWNSAFNSSQFWDGRAATLEDQAKGPVVNPIEMGMSELEEAMDRVRDIPGYRPYFEAAFGTEDPMTVDNAAKAVAAYERTLITPGGAFDRYVKGDKEAMTEQQVRGMNTFAELGCVACHSGAAFSGPAMPPGSGFFAKFPTFPESDYVKQYDLTADEGRMAVTGKEADKHMWKVPTLRNIALTAPYFHNGSVKTLDEAVRVMAKVQLNQDLTDEQAADVAAFLMTLTGEFPQQSLPQLPPTHGRSIVN